MRTLSSELREAQRSPSRRPYLQVDAWDYLAGVARPSFTRLYTGGEPDHFHDVLLAPDGSLLRARTTASGTLYVQRVPNPGPSSDFATWTSLGTVSAQAGISLCREGSTVHLFYVDANNLSIYERTSTDSGVTWSAPQGIITPAVPALLDLAADVNPSGVLALFYVSNQSAVYVIRRVGGVWQNPEDWPHGRLTIRGIDCVYQGDWNLCLAGQNSAGVRVWGLIYGDGTAQAVGTWSGLATLASATSGSLVSFHYPFLASADVFRLAYVEQYGGTVASSRPLWSHSLANTAFADYLWREPIPFDTGCDYGLALTSDGATLWLSTPFGVWRGDLEQAPLSLTDDVLEARLEERPEPSTCLLILDNSDGKYATPGGTGLERLRQGSELRVAPGYLTTTGPQTSPGPRYWVTGWEHRSSPGASLLFIRATDAWGLLARWRARHQWTWGAGTLDVVGILRVLLARVGLALDATGVSATATTHRPRFTVHPGEYGHVAVRRLLDMVPDVLLFRDAVGVLKVPSGADPVDYSYGGTHAIEEGRYVEQAPAVNRVQVYGQPGMAEAFSWPHIADVYDRLLQVHDLNLATAADMTARASDILAARLREAQAGEIVVPANCGQELYDVVEITDARTGKAPFQRRVVGLTLEYARHSRAVYRHRLALGRL